MLEHLTSSHKIMEDAANEAINSKAKFETVVPKIRVLWTDLSNLKRSKQIWTVIDPARIRTLRAMP